jgi:hypothetical protein
VSEPQDKIKLFAVLTDLMSRVWSGMATLEYKQHKDLKNENLRDNMTNTELVPKPPKLAAQKINRPKALTQIYS